MTTTTAVLYRLPVIAEYTNICAATMQVRMNIVHIV